MKFENFLREKYPEYQYSSFIRGIIALAETWHAQEVKRVKAYKHVVEKKGGE